MCGRYGFHIENRKEFIRRFAIEMAEFNEELLDNWNVAPSSEMPVIERHSPNGVYKRTWGLQPAWSPIYLINAKREKLEESNIWHTPFRENRVIIPASYFIEWKKRADNSKQPYVIQLKNKELFGFAGLLVTMKDKDDKEQTGYVIITQKASTFMSNIHDRQPVILKRENEDAWLNHDTVETDHLMKLLDPFPYDEEMESYQVSTLINKPSNNFPELLQPLEAK